MEKNSKSVIELELTASYTFMASNKRDGDVCRKEREKAGGGVFFRKQPRKTRGNRQNMNYKKLGMEGGGGRGGRRNT